MKLEEIVIAIPHASTVIPDDIRALIPHSDETLLRDPDLYTDRIYTIDGPRKVLAEYSRIIADPNRAPDEIYTEGPLRSIGVVMLSQAGGLDVFAEDPSIEQMTEWIRRFHRPFHHMLYREMNTPGTRFLVDAHSLLSVSPPAYRDAGEARADIVLGNREYSACSAETTQFFRAYFEERGLSVAINEPFPGRYILGTYANRLRTPGIQIEVNRKLYMDEATLEPHDAEIQKLHGMISELLERFCAWDEEHGTDRHMIDLSEVEDKLMTDSSEVEPAQ